MLVSCKRGTRYAMLASTPMGRTGSVLAALAATACVGELPPNAEVVIVIDTDLPVPRLAGALRIDIFDDGGTWLESRTIARPDPADWPASFSLQAPDNVGRTRILRVRAFPQGALRDYRGEHFHEAMPFVAPFVAHSIEELCAAPPELQLDEPLVVRAGRDPFLGSLEGGDCSAWGTTVGSAAAFIDIERAGTYRFAVLTTAPLWIDGNPGQVTLQLREACDDASSALACSSGIINPSWTRADITVDLQRGRYFLLTAGSHPDTAPRDIALGAALASAWPAEWESYRIPRPVFEDPCAPTGLAPTLPDGTAPASEPVPESAVDRLAHVRLVPDEKSYVRLTLRGACAGTMARLGPGCPVTDLVPEEAETCIDTEGVREPLVEAAPVSSEEAFSPSRAGEFGEGTPCEEDHPESPVVCIPGGIYLLGSRADSGYTLVLGVGGVASVPERVTAMPRFWIDRYEMTVGRLRDAVALGFDTKPGGISLVAVNNGQLASTSSLDPRTLCTWSDMPLGREEYPLVCVSWYGARALCQFFGGDLPTEAEWEYVASAAGRSFETRYPWGDEPPDCERAAIARSDEEDHRYCWFGASTFGPLPVTARPLDVTPQGVVGLGGSVSEWQLDAFETYDAPCWRSTTQAPRRCEQPDAPFRARRGNSWAGFISTSYVTLRGRQAAGIFDTFTGVRCKYDAPPP